MADMNAKGRHVRGKNVLQAKLTEEKVREIRAAIRCGEVQKSIAERFGIDQSNVSQIKRGFSWKWLQ